MSELTRIICQLVSLILRSSKPGTRLPVSYDPKEFESVDPLKLSVVETVTECDVVSLGGDLHDLTLCKIKRQLPCLGPMVQSIQVLLEQLCINCVPDFSINSAVISEKPHR